MITRSLSFLLLAIFSLQFPAEAQAQTPEQTDTPQTPVEMSDASELESSLFDSAAKELESPIPFVEDTSSENVTTQTMPDEIVTSQLQNYPSSANTYTIEIIPDHHSGTVICTSGG